ncbi:MAG: hypothetical protein J6W69_00380 [Bacteroidales bacterium]|nr:hypothetical protein [Bacteroidales bacterium]
MVGLIYRAHEFSPGDNVARDAATLDAVGRELQRMGEEVVALSEEELTLANVPTFDRCVTMARRQRSLLILQKMQMNGLRLLNRPNAVQITVQSRSTTMEMLQAAGIQVAPFWSYEPSADEMFQCEPELQSLLPAWVKAMHPRGVTAGDVMRVETALEADSRVIALATSGYTDIVVMRHIEGTLLKAYVVGQRVWTRDGDATPLAIIETSRKIGQVIGLEAYGVDFIVSANGAYVIDVNDFPSFSSCRDEAAQAIAFKVMRL